MNPTLAFEGRPMASSEALTEVELDLGFPPHRSPLGVYYMHVPAQGAETKAPLDALKRPFCWHDAA